MSRGRLGVDHLVGPSAPPRSAHLNQFSSVEPFWTSTERNSILQQFEGMIGVDDVEKRREEVAAAASIAIAAGVTFHLERRGE